MNGETVLVSVSAGYKSSSNHLPIVFKLKVRTESSHKLTAISSNMDIFFVKRMEQRERVKLFAFTVLINWVQL